MRYWPLTAVLLAFWLGRETGAQSDAPKVAKFDRIEAKTIVTGSLVAGEGAVAGGRTTVDEYGVQILSGKFARSQDGVRLNCSALQFSKTRPNRATDRASTARTTPVAKFGSLYVNGEDVGVMMIYNAEGKATVAAFAGMRDSLARVSVCDRLGRNRAVLGGAPKPPGRDDERTESALTLLDAQGEILERLPR